MALRTQWYVCYERAQRKKGTIERIIIQIETLESASEQAKKQAQTAKDHIDTAKEQLTKIKNLVENLSGRKLGDLVDQLNNDRRTDEISQDLSVSENHTQSKLTSISIGCRTAV